MLYQSCFFSVHIDEKHTCITVNRSKLLFFFFAFYLQHNAKITVKIKHFGYTQKTHLIKKKKTHLISDQKKFDINVRYNSRWDLMILTLIWWLWNCDFYWIQLNEKKENDDFENLWLWKHWNFMIMKTLKFYNYENVEILWLYKCQNFAIMNANNSWLWKWILWLWNI